MLRILIAIAVLSVGWIGRGSAQLVPLPAQPDAVEWPAEDWTPAPLANDVDEASLERALSEAMPASHPDLGETRAIAIVQDGRLVLERYAPGFTRDTRLISWSVAKSITQALVGAAMHEGRIDPHAPMGSPHWPQGDPRGAISWRTWLSMIDGQPWSELRARTVLDNDSAHMLFGIGRTDQAAYAANLPLVHTPGTHWNYNSGGIVLVADALTRRIVPDPRDARDRRQRMRAWMDRALFAPIGMRPIVQFDARGTFFGSAEIYATARDFARFGLLYLRGGVWNGTRILPEGWVDFARTPAASTDVYGAGFWVTPAQGPGRPWRGLLAGRGLADAFYAEGRAGQLIVVVPSKDLVVVRLGLFEDTLHRWQRLGAWTARIANCFAARKR